MFYKNEKINKLELEIKSLSKEKSRLEDKLSTIEDKKDKEIENLKADQEIELKRMKLKLDVDVSEATKKIKGDLETTTMERNNLKKECEILNKAFQNLGFDVKDMKDILNKLVDGIVSKNTIQLVK